MLRPLVSVACLAAATAAAAEPARLSGQTIKETLAGAVIEIDTPAGTTIPVRFSRQGLVSGDARGLAAVLGAARDRGRWWVAGDQLCVKWFRWFEAEVRCIDLQQDGARLFWRGPEGRSGTATIAERPAPQSPAYALGAQMAARQKLGEIAKTVSRASVTLPVLRLITPAEAAPAPKPGTNCTHPRRACRRSERLRSRTAAHGDVPLPQKAPPFAERRAKPPVRPAAARSKGK